jgi:hypothetical protein
LTDDGLVSRKLTRFICFQSEKVTLGAVKTVRYRLEESTHSFGEVSAFCGHAAGLLITLERMFMELFFAIWFGFELVAFLGRNHLYLLHRSGSAFRSGFSRIDGFFFSPLRGLSFLRRTLTLHFRFSDFTSGSSWNDPTHDLRGCRRIFCHSYGFFDVESQHREPRRWVRRFVTSSQYHIVFIKRLPQ